MNLAQLKGNVGWYMELVPPACHVDDRGRKLPDRNEDWLVRRVDGDVVEVSDPEGRLLRLGKDHVHSFATNPQRSDAAKQFGFLRLHVQVFVCGNAITVKPNARPGEAVAPQAIDSIEKIVSLSYPDESGIQQRLKQQGFKLYWCLESKVATFIDLQGWELVEELDSKGQLCRFRCKDPHDDLMLIRKRE